MFYFSENNIRGNHAGTKARNDVEQILTEYGCRPINSKSYVLTSDDDNNIRSNINNRVQLAKYFLDLLKVKNEIVFIQYPMLSFDKDREYLIKIAKRNKLVFLIHDVHGLKRQNKSEIDREISLLNLADAVIVHNIFMENKLIDCGLSVKKIYRLNIFDYIYNGSEVPTHFNERGIAFAGNLEKTGFFKQFCDSNKNTMLYLYGQKYDNSLDAYSNIEYCGNFKPDEISEKLVGKYGLVWDGDSISTCSGIFGEYTRYNNPHKLSLYIVSTLPVIVWEEAAIAEFVKNKNIGIAVSSLENIDKKLSDISEEDYKSMYKNVLKLRKDLTTGNTLKSVLKKIEEDLDR